MNELSQLWSIFKEEMSFVGPRALRGSEVEVHRQDAGTTNLFDLPNAHRRMAVQPGLTGVAQVYAPRDVVRRQKFRYDMIYITRHSFWLDLKLMFMSLWVTLTGRWEERSRPIGRRRRR